MISTHLIRRLTADDAAAFREIVTEAVGLHPTAFATTPEEERARPETEIVGRLAAEIALGGFGGDSLDAVLRLQRLAPSKRRHVAMLWGMYVRPAQRGTGLAQALLGTAIDWARGEVDQLELYVADGNERAARLYQRFGLTHYGRMPRSLRVDGRDYDADMMVLILR
jgi:GNAT superfamily N-acetyltransferase